MREAMYKFVKIYNTHYDITHGWALLCEDYQTLADHNQLYFRGEIKKGVSDLINQVQTGQHLSSNWGIALQVSAEVKNTNLLDTSQNLEKEVLQTKMEMIDKYGAIVLRENCSYAPLQDTDKIIDQVNYAKMIYPGNDESNIRIIQWDGGKHFYAKIGGMDVIYKDKAKWSTHKAAMTAAINYLKESV